MNAIVPVQSAQAEKIFEFDGEPFRTRSADGQPLFHATDVARSLGYRDAGNMTRLLGEGEITTQRVRGGFGEIRDVTYLTKAGLFRAILNRNVSKKLPKKIAERIEVFQRWVSHDVLPAIQETGSYTLPGAQPLTHADLLAALMDPEQVVPLLMHHAKQTLVERARANALTVELASEQEAHSETHQHLEDTTRLLTVESRRAETTGRALVVAHRQIEEQAPIVHRHRALVEADGAMSVTDAANVVGVPRSELFRFLRDNDGREPWLYVRPGTVQERPFRPRVAQKYMRVRLVPIRRSNGTVEQNPQPLITPKGLDRILVDFPTWAAEQARKAEGRHEPDLFDADGRKVEG
jgi:prophage antirepressor-like protein/phage antirepressor YoqD-like protein